MDISVTEFRAQCLELIRQVENGGQLVARLTPPSARSAQSPQPWTTLRGSGVLHAEPGETVLEAHVWLWWLLGSERLQPQERRSLDHLAPPGVPTSRR